MTEKQTPFKKFIQETGVAKDVDAFMESLQAAAQDITTLTISTDAPKGIITTSISLDGDTYTTISGEFDANDQFLNHHNQMVASAMRNRMEVVRMLVDVLGIGKLAALL